MQKPIFIFEFISGKEYLILYKYMKYCPIYVYNLSMTRKRSNLHIRGTSLTAAILVKARENCLLKSLKKIVIF